MIILPAIDIKDGNCVRLIKGDFDTVHKVAENPLQTARSFEQDGAEWLHMVDLDGAKDAAPKNRPVFLEIAARTRLKVEVGGGIRDLETVEEYLTHGIARVILGSVAVKKPEVVRIAVREYGERIAVGIDARDGMVAVDGWLGKSEVNYLDLAHAMADVGVKTIIFTDISKDGTLTGPNLDQLAQINGAADCNIIASGGISSIEDIHALKKLGLYGAICGKSLYQGTLSLKEALKVAKE
ncbi:MAG TPA: 1-(5-phosphoribosyl)-5-[(5-phosphoribosylamino)methylideneamino]imidazole-4-carboxamide isomerase [Candidatus Faecivivens stercorigallinarum]|nr:1-(5-phosphoribosyl)-5-[(5-phosphoribosylamino)methylideneamino]imidazole-4-carboxamide isomerase [Candidatus Faecivivens stercorigallinarum]